MKKNISLSFLLVSFAAAQNLQLDTISVTATGLEETLFEQPLSIEKKDKKSIELDQVIYQKDLFNSISGVRIEQTGSVIGHMTAIRMPLNTGPYYLFLQDGIPVQSSGFFNHNGLAYTTYQNAESIDVLKGTGSALYGSDAVAAVIDVHALNLDRAQRSFWASAGSYGFFQLKATDIVHKKDAKYGIKADYMHSDGYRDHTDTMRGEINVAYEKMVNDTNIVTIRFNASKTEANQADSFNNYDNIVHGSKAASDDPAYFLALQKSDVKRKFDFALLSTEWNNFSFDPFEIDLTGYLRYNRNQYTATWEKNLPHNDNKLYTLGLRNKNIYEDAQQKFVFGFDGEYTLSKLRYDQPFTITTSGWGAKTYYKGPLYDYDVNYLAFAPYLHYERSLTSKWKFSIGLRYDFNRFDYNNNLAPDSYDPSGTYFRPADRTDNFTHLSPKAALSYFFTDKQHLYLRYANGFRIPQAGRLYSLKKGSEFVKLDPEISNTYEIGYKFFNNPMQWDIALYYMMIDDTITRYESNGILYYANGGRTLHRGVEITTQYNLDLHNSIYVAYTYARHNYDDNEKYHNNELAQAPNHIADVRYIYRNGPWTIMPEWRYVGSYWMDDAHTYKYKGYSIGHLKVRYDYSPSLRFFAKIINITDKKYAAYARYAYGKTDYTPGDPRTFYAGLEYRW